MRHRFPEHRYKYGKQEKGINLQDFVHILERVDEINLLNYTPLMIKAFLTLLYWTGLRKTEATGARAHRYILKPYVKRTEPEVRYTDNIKGIMKEDIYIDDEYLCINAIARKHGQRKGALRLYLGLPYVNLIVDQWMTTEPNTRVFPISEYDSWWIMHNIDPKLYLHFFRFNRITALCSDPDMSIVELCSWTGLHVRTIQSYMERSERYIKSTAEKMRKSLIPRVQLAETK